jgi:hypothetical protein
MMTMTTERRHAGFALLLMLLLLFVGGSSVLLGALNNRQSIVQGQQEEVAYQLQQAKARLLAYAAASAQLSSNVMGPGFFPCPDMDSSNVERIPADSCDSDLPLLGRLPEYALHAGSRFAFNNSYSGIDQQFWLVVAPRYVYHSTNSASQRRSNRRTNKTAVYAAPLRLRLDGQGPYVAFLIAPGEALDTQDRVNGADNFSNYLDGGNGSSGFDYFSSNAANPAQFNDVIIGISLDEYMQVVGGVVANAIMAGLENYYNVNHELPASSTSGNTSFENVFNAALPWLRRNTLGNGERWADTPNNVLWIRSSLDDDQGTLTFGGYPDLCWYLNKDNNTVHMRKQPDCQ